MNPKTLQSQLGLARYVTELNIDSLSHEDSLVQPKRGGNCLNWALGHIVRSRILQLQLLGKTSPYALEDYDAYDAAPVTGVGEAKSWDTLVEQFRALQKPIEEGLEAITDEALAAEAPFSPTDNPDETIGSLLAGLSFHEAYHAGQIGLLRRIVGKQGAIGSPRPEVATA